MILACRDPRQAEAELRRGSNKVDVRRLGLSSLQSVRHFAAGIVEDGVRQDTLINDAGEARRS